MPSAKKNAKKNVKKKPARPVAKKKTHTAVNKKNIATFLLDTLRANMLKKIKPVECWAAASNGKITAVFPTARNATEKSVTSLLLDEEVLVKVRIQVIS